MRAHPVGTGPLRLAQWRRGSQIVLEKNPRFRQQRFSTVGAGNAPHLQAAAQHLAGRQAPLLDRVGLQIIELRNSS